MNTRLWKKLSKYAADVGYEVAKMVLELYYTSKAKGTPIPIKTAIWGALAYFIVPTDAILDFAPGGYVDDGGILAGALVTARAYMTVEAARQAKNKLSQLFGSSGDDKSGGISRAGSSAMKGTQVVAKSKTGGGAKPGGVRRLGPGKADGSKYNAKNYREDREKKRG